MAIKGSLKEASLPDVLQLLALGQKTGCLSIADRSNFGYIYFEKGRICYASIVNRRDRLGDILVKHSKITQGQLEAAVHRQTKEHGKKLGEVLVGMGVITQEDLERYVRVQIEESVYYLFTWTQGTFNFESDVRPERQDFLVSINPESLLLEGARRVDEWSLIEKKIPSFDLIFVVDKDRLAISEAKLTDTQQRLLPLLDASRDVNQVIEDSGLGEFEIGKALYGLITAGFVHRAGRTASPADAQITDARVEEHRNLGVAFYKTAMLDEAAREFRRVAELRPGEANAHFYIGLVALKQARWREAMEALRQAAEKGGGRPAVFHNLGFAYEQLGRLDEAEAAYGEAATRARTDAKVYLGWGVVALKRGDYGGAAVVAALERHHTPAQIHLGVGPRPRRGFSVGGFRLVEPPELLICEAEVVEHRRPAAALLRGLAQRLHRLAPPRLLEGDEADIEVGVRFAGAQLGHTAKLARRLVQHGGLVERDAQVTVLLHPRVGDLSVRRRRGAPGPMHEPGGDQAVQRLADLELAQPGIFDHLVHVTRCIEQRQEALLRVRELGLADGEPVLVHD